MVVHSGAACWLPLLFRAYPLRQSPEVFFNSFLQVLARCCIDRRRLGCGRRNVAE